MAAEIRVDKIKSRAGINTLSFSEASGFSFNPHVGIGTTVPTDPVKSTNTAKLAVGIVSAREQYVGLITANRGAGYSYVNVGTGLSVVGIATFQDNVQITGITTFNDAVNVGLVTTGDLTQTYIHVGTGVSVVGIATFHDTVRIAGITTFGSTSHIKLPSGTDAQRPGTGLAGDFRYNTTSGSFEGYTTEWGAIGGGGGVSQVSGIVSTTSTVGFAASFAIAHYRSASVNFLVTQGAGASAEWQTGKYLMIHDGTTVTVVEQAAVATNTMIATISGAISGANAELLVTMGAAGVATCSAKIDTMADSA